MMLAIFVSILVFVELALGLSAAIGSSEFQRFQSLFLWNLPSDYHTSGVGVAVSTGFQSLFLWNLPSDRAAFASSILADRVSILVFVELALGQPDSWFLASASWVSILVFVELALGLWPYSSSISLAECFNPCFCGTCPRTGHCRAGRLFFS